MAEPLIPARLSSTADGTPYSEAYGDVYHSAAGGPGQARHVFLAGNGLPERWRGRRRFVILETGFGTGVNFLSTWAAWRADAQPRGQLHYLAAEKHPFTVADLARIHARWPELASLAERLRAAWPCLVPGYHQLDLDDADQGGVRLTLMLGDAAGCLERLTARVDALYLDGFAPQRNPDMWSPELLRRLGRLASPGATLATWCVAGAVRDALAGAGFRLERRPGYGGKRQMLTGTHTGMPDQSPAGWVAPEDGERHALIVGAGLAGCACARSLARRGWRVTLLERHDGPAREASGNLAGIVRPLLSLDDNIASRFTRAAYLHALRVWRGFDAQGVGPRRAARGVLQIARDPAHEARQRAVIAAHAYPADYARFVEADAAADLTGWPVAAGGWLFPAGGWASPPSVCAANLAAAEDRVRGLFGQGVEHLRRQDGLWRALDSAGRVIAEAPVVVLAGGARSGELVQAAGLNLSRVRGQVTHIPAPRLPPFRLVMSRDGYVIPDVDGVVCAGASYSFDDDPEARAKDDAGNLARLELILPGTTSALEPGALAAKVGFRAVPPDRLPLVGQLPDLTAMPADGAARLATLPRQAGIFGLLGLASRGLVWAQLAAELLAAQLDGSPLPLENDLVAAVDPARFWLRRARKAAGRH